MTIIDPICKHELDGEELTESMTIIDLIYKLGFQEFNFTIQGDSLNFGGVLITEGEEYPEVFTERMEEPRQIKSMVDIWDVQKGLYKCLIKDTCTRHLAFGA